MNRRRKLIVVISEDWYVASHRLPLLRVAHDAGWEVIAATRGTGHAETIAATGARVVTLQLAREGRSVLGELRAIRELTRLYRTERPDLVHHVALKPIIYGSIAARLAGVPRVINAFAGMGYLYADRTRSRLLRGIAERALWVLFRATRSWALVQNADDQALLAGDGVVPSDRLRVVGGTGVDLRRFPRRDEPVGGEPLVVLASRMLRDKGVVEFVDAARQLRDAGIAARFVLVGPTDPANPAAIAAPQLQAWVDDGVIEWWGPRRDMPDVLASASVVVLPSYREGLPKVLAEALATGRAVVATDVPGCRDVVQHEWNGLLVPVRDAAALAGAIRRLLSNPAERRLYGNRGREFAESELVDVASAERVLAVYDEIMR